MKRYFIKNVRCDITGGGMACGPVSGHVVTSLTIEYDGKTEWLNSIEVDGFPQFNLTEKDIFVSLVKEDFDDEEFYAYLDEHYIDEFDGLELGAEYSDIFASLHGNENHPAVALIRYMIDVIRCPMDELENLITLAKGKYIDEVQVPYSEDEIEFCEDEGIEIKAK